MASRGPTDGSCLLCTCSLIALLPCLAALGLPRHIYRLRPVLFPIRSRPTKNLLAAMAQEVASERYVAFALDKKQAFDTLKVHASNVRTGGGPQSRGTRRQRRISPGVRAVSLGRATHWAMCPRTPPSSAAGPAKAGCSTVEYS